LLDLICADPHFKEKDQFGSLINFQGERVDKRTLYKIFRFRQIIKKHKPNRTFICGDLFDSPKPPEWIRATFFNEIAPLTDLYILTGNHDAKGKYPIGTSESLMKLKNITVVPCNNIITISPNPYILCGYTRDYVGLVDKLKELDTKAIVLGHGDHQKEFAELPLTFLFGHTHSHFVKGNFHSIGSLFKDSWAEENEKCGFYLCEDNKLAWVENPDLKLLTLTEPVEPPEGYHAIRYKLNMKANDLKSIDTEKLSSSHKKVFLDIDIQEEKVMKFVDVKDTIRTFLKEQGLTQEQFDFGKQLLRG